MRLAEQMPTAPCVVCGRRVGSRWYASEWGDSWCISHDDLPHCSLCGVPVADRRDTMCRACGADIVRSRTEVADPLHQVGGFMASAGLVVSKPTKLVLRDVTDLRRRGLFDGTPHQHGVTKWQTDHNGSLVGEIEIGIASGLPSALFRTVLAHEFGHALLAGTRARNLAPNLIEGFSEALAALYLESCQGSRAERIELERLRRNRDPVYGGGYRIVAPAVRSYGVHATLDALRAGVPGRVGLVASRAR